MDTFPQIFRRRSGGNRLFPQSLKSLVLSLVSSRHHPLAPLAPSEYCGVWGTLNEDGSLCYWAGVWVVFQTSIHCYSCDSLRGSSPLGPCLAAAPTGSMAVQCPFSNQRQLACTKDFIYCRLLPGPATKPHKPRSNSLPSPLITPFPQFDTALSQEYDKTFPPYNNRLAGQNGRRPYRTGPTTR